MRTEFTAHASNPPGLCYQSPHSIPRSRLFITPSICPRQSITVHESNPPSTASGGTRASRKLTEVDTEIIFASHCVFNLTKISFNGDEKNFISFFLNL